MRTNRMTLLPGSEMKFITTFSVAITMASCGNFLRSGSEHVALVYRGPAASCASGCSESAGRMLERSPWNFKITFVGPGEAMNVNEALSTVEESNIGSTVYVQPGGNGSLDNAATHMAPYAPAIRDFVSHGGRYLGICMGGYLAGVDPGFGLLKEHGDSDSFADSPGSDIHDEDDRVVPVYWPSFQSPSTLRHLYFQDGPYFYLHNPNSSSAMIVASYVVNGAIASLVVPYGHGKVAVSGPHPEATTEWFRRASLPVPEEGPGEDLGHNLIGRLLE